MAILDARGAQLDVPVLASAAGDITLTASAGKVILGSPLTLKAYTVATLPAASIGAGNMAYVTDSKFNAVANSFLKIKEMRAT